MSTGVRYPWPTDHSGNYAGNYAGAERQAGPGQPGPHQPIPTEAEEQRTVAEWLDLAGVLWCHVPNESKRTKAQTAILIGLGLKQGAPDNLIFDPPPAAPWMPGAALELKRRLGGVLGPGQAEWLDALARRGWAAACCSGAAEAIAWLEELGYGRRTYGRGGER